MTLCVEIGGTGSEIGSTCCVSWVFGCLGVWVFGCLGVWVFGCLGVKDVEICLSFVLAIPIISISYLFFYL